MLTRQVVQLDLVIAQSTIAPATSCTSFSALPCGKQHIAVREASLAGHAVGEARVHKSAQPPHCAGFALRALSAPRYSMVRGDEADEETFAEQNDYEVPLTRREHCGRTLCSSLTMRAA